MPFVAFAFTKRVQGATLSKIQFQQAIILPVEQSRNEKIVND